MSELLKALHWRYATKKMDASKTVPQEKVEQILEAVRLTASSSGLQPYQVFVVTNPALREQIKAVAWNQAQVTDCSHLLVFAAWDNYTTDRINQMFDLVNTERGGDQRGAHAARQAYIGVGTALIAAAEQQVDSTPMEGFDPAKVDEIMGLAALGLRSVVIVPLGYRADEGDWLVNLKKVRRPRDQFITELA